MDFDCIYKSYYLDVYHFLCGLSSNKEIAEDITQETLIFRFDEEEYIQRRMERKEYE